MTFEEEDGDEDYRQDVSKIIDMIDILKNNDKEEEEEIGSEEELEEDPEEDLKEDVYVKYGISSDEGKFLLKNTCHGWSNKF